MSSLPIGSFPTSLPSASSSSSQHSAHVAVSQIADRVSILAQIKSGELKLDQVSVEFRNDQEIVSAAIEKNPMSFLNASNELKKVKAIALPFIKMLVAANMQCLADEIDPALYQDSEVRAAIIEAQKKITRISVVSCGFELPIDRSTYTK